MVVMDIHSMNVLNIIKLYLKNDIYYTCFTTMKKKKKRWCLSWDDLKTSSAGTIYWRI